MTPDAEDTTSAQPSLVQDHNGRIAMLLAMAAFIPFATLAIWLAAIEADHPWRGMTILLLKGNGAIILSFLGGIRWGLATGEDNETTPRLLGLSALPPLAGWAALMVPDMTGFALLAAAFAAHGAWDQFAVHGGTAPDWFGRLRTRMTMLVTAAMVLAMIAVA